MSTSQPNDAAELFCDVLLFFSTTTEKEQLEAAAIALGVFFERRRYSGARYYRLGAIGDFRVNAIQTEMGPLGFRGSAYQGIHWQHLTAATAIVQLGMAFGIAPAHQAHGDVLVASSLIPYDYRDVRADRRSCWARLRGHYAVDNSRALRHPAKESFVTLFRRFADREELPHRVFFGALLSGGTRIFSRRYRDELAIKVPAGDDRIVGGEMEGVGLLSISDRSAPVWIVVNGISDFADENRDIDFEANRMLACQNSARFVLRSLLTMRTVA